MIWRDGHVKIGPFEYVRVGDMTNSRPGAVPYQTRWRLGSARLHRFHRGDGDPDPHDHPFSFWTRPLCDYVEEVHQHYCLENVPYYLMDEIRANFELRSALEYDRLRLFRRSVNLVTAGDVHYRPAEYAHRILHRADGGVETEGVITTLVWATRKKRDWGFWVEEPYFSPSAYILNELAEQHDTYRMASHGYWKFSNPTKLYSKPEWFLRRFVPWKQYVGIDWTDK